MRTARAVTGCGARRGDERKGECTIDRAAHTAAPLFVVVPRDIDDAATPSGGDIYDRRICDALTAAGRQVHEIASPGDWPRPDSRARDLLDRSLTAVPDGSPVLLDGLVACGVPEVIVAQAGRLRLAVLVHLPLAAETGLPSAVAAELDERERAVLHAVPVVIATSRWAAGRLIDHHRLPSGRVHVVAPGVDPAPPTAAATPGTGTGGRNLLCVASLTPRKGHDLLIEALARIAASPWNCRFVGPSGAADWTAGLVDRIERRGLAERIELAGPRTGAALAAEYAKADLLVLPTRGETYGMVLTEALARGIPVLATAVDAVPDTLGRDPAGRVPGLLVPPGDPAALADALRRWLGDAGLRGTLRAAALGRRDSLPGWPEAAERMDRALTALAGRRTPIEERP